MKITKRRGILALVTLGVLQFSGAGAQEGVWRDVKPLENAESSGINGPTFDRGPDLSADGLELFFDSNRADGQDDWNMFVATRAALDEPFGNVRALDELNTTDSERAAHISADGLTLYFTGDRGNTDLYLARRAGPGAPFDERENLGPGVNSEFSESQPSLSVNGLELYFSSDRSGNTDLYVATRAAVDQAFGNVVRLDALSTTSFESSPDISADGLTLFFFRNPGPVSAQIWMATRESTADDFANPPINLGPSINTGFTFSPGISPEWPADRATLYYSKCVSNSDCDIYQATWISYSECLIDVGSSPPDCNENGLADACEIKKGAVQDIDENGTPDDCEDCNSNAMPDLLEISSGAAPDCNGNDVPDDCDIADGIDDLDKNGIPNVCDPHGLQLPGDANQDGGFDVSDAVTLFGFLFNGTPSQLPCGDGTREYHGNVLLVDHNGDGKIDIANGVAVLNWLFGRGPAHALQVPGQETDACALIIGCRDVAGCPE